mgnify:CR=1 FL=1
MSSAIEMTLTQLRDALAAGAVSSVEATRAYLDAIAARDGTIRAYTQVFAERALERAAAARNYPLTLRMQPGYDHSYYFIASFIDDHLRHHAQALLG